MTSFSANFNLRRTFLFLIVGIASWCYGAEFFRSDLEMGETCLAQKLEVGHPSIFLVPNARLSEWPVSGGVGVVEFNLPRQTEYFTYESREGNRLVGVEGIHLVHPQWAEIQTGGMGEWKKQGVSEASLQNPNIRVEREDAIFGAFSARFITGRAPLAAVGIPVAPGSVEMGCRFHLRFQLDGSKEYKGRFPVLYAHYGNAHFPRVYIVTANNRSSRIMMGGEGDWRVLKKVGGDPVPLHFDGRAHCVEYRIRVIDSLHARAELRVDGKGSSVLQLRYPILAPKAGWMFWLGRNSGAPCPGELVVDEILVATEEAGCKPRRPELVWSGKRFKLETDMLPHAAQWQISSENQWVLPKFNTGAILGNRGTHRLPHYYTIPLHSPSYLPAANRTMDSARVPVGLAYGKPYLARVRLQSMNGIWGDWSQPADFTPRRPVPDWIGRLEALPVVEKAVIANPGGRRPVRNIERGEWYDFAIAVGDPRGWEHLSVVDVFFSTGPGGGMGSYDNRGGAFCAKNNYAFSLSLARPSRLYARQREGKMEYDLLMNRKGLYCDASGNAFRVDSEEGVARVRVRILSQSDLGLWTARAYAQNNEGKVSAIYQTVFNVRERRTEKTRVPVLLQIGGTLLLGLAVLFLLLRIKTGPGERRGWSGTDSESDLLPLRVDPGQQKRVDEARSYILDHYHKAISSKDVAVALNVSPGYFSEFFSRATGKPVSQYINEVRIERAKWLLKQSEMNVTQIAYQVGFNSLDYFLKVFRTQTGVSPNQYRKHHKGRGTLARRFLGIGS